MANLKFGQDMASALIKERKNLNTSAHIMTNS